MWIMTTQSNPSAYGGGGHPVGRCRKAIPATCQLHRGPVGFTNLMVNKCDDGSIVLDPHVTGSCVISLHEESARTLRDLLTQWLGGATYRKNRQP
jgi:hypothetical protein